MVSRPIRAPTPPPGNMLLSTASPRAALHRHPRRPLVKATASSRVKPPWWSRTSTTARAHWLALAASWQSAPGGSGARVRHEVRGVGGPPLRHRPSAVQRDPGRALRGGDPADREGARTACQVWTWRPIAAVSHHMIQLMTLVGAEELLPPPGRHPPVDGRHQVVVEVGPERRRRPVEGSGGRAPSPGSTPEGERIGRRGVGPGEEFCSSARRAPGPGVQRTGRYPARWGAVPGRRARSSSGEAAPRVSAPRGSSSGPPELLQGVLPQLVGGHVQGVSRSRSSWNRSSP